MNWLPGLAVALALQPLPELQTTEPVRVAILYDSDRCAVTVDDVRMEGAAFTRQAGVWARDSRPVRVRVDLRAPYACIGKFISAMDAAGIRRSLMLRDQSQPRVEVVITAASCDPEIQGRIRPLSDLRTEAAAWKRNGTAVHFEPEPMADAKCVADARDVLEHEKGLVVAFVEANPAP